MTAEALVETVERRTARVAVLGQGYIGLPLSLLLASSGYSVVGYDVNKSLVRRLERGDLPIEEKGLSDLLEEAGERYTPTGDPSALEESDVFIVAVPTPRSNGGADLSYVWSALREVAERARPPFGVVVESTLPPGAFRRMIDRSLGGAGLLGRDFLAAYCPERAMPGRLVRELVENPRVIGAYDGKSARMAELLYRSFSKGDITITTPEVAEVVKLVENTFRDVNIALANEVARICDALGVSAREVIEIANKHPRVNLLIPGIGVGGSCLTKDPVFLASSAEEAGYSPKVVESSRVLNEDMPFYALRIILDSLSRTGNGRKRVAVLGVTYKGGVGDHRESPVEPIVRGLLSRGVEVVVYDPRTEETFGGKRAESLEEALNGADLVLIGADHPEFKTREFRRELSRLPRGTVVFDGKWALDPREVEAMGLVYVSVGMIERLNSVLSRESERVQISSL